VLCLEGENKRRVRFQKDWEKNWKATKKKQRTRETAERGIARLFRHEGTWVLPKKRKGWLTVCHGDQQWKGERGKF